MEYITTKEASAKWGISTSRITLLANEGRIPGAKRLGRSWMIPVNATKPAELKPHHSKSAKKNTDNFSFPPYHFRPDFSSIKESQLSYQQHGCLWNIGISSIALNKPDDYTKAYLRLQNILAEDIPHRDDLTVILDALKTYVDTINTAANNDDYNTDIHEQCIPMTCMLVGYAQLTTEAMAPGTANTTMLKFMLRFLQSTSAAFTTEMVDIYLMYIYFFRHDLEKAERYAKEAVQIAYENKIYFPLITYYRYNTLILAPVLAQYPKDFQDHFLKLHSQYETNYTSFLESFNEYSTIARLNDNDFPYVYAVSMGLSNSLIAEKFGVSTQTVIRRLEKIYEKLEVNSKKELREYLHKYM